MQTEITKSQPLLNDRGHIIHPGWARQLFWEYDRSRIHASKWRIKEWDYYLVANEHYGVAFTISDLGYIGLISVSFLNFDENWEHTETVFEPFPFGKYKMPPTSVTGDVAFHNKQLHLTYDVTPGQRKISCHFFKFYEGKDLNAELSLSQPDMDTMCIATPWKEKPTAFYYNQKINCLPATGYATLGDITYEFFPDRDAGVLDWGRGVWTYDNTWYWGTGSGFLDGEPFGFNLGYGFTDRSSASENVLFYKNKAHKLDEVSFEIPRKADGSYDYLKKWKITSNDGRLNASFCPVLNRHADMNVLVIATDQNQVFGHLTGTAVLDDGTKLNFSDFFCAIEVVHNRY
ncbi:MAG: DUF2804 domain-containing protein [Roseburia sp.]|nr:DUF2804 domain-containing protein [Roseburia sp.]